MGDPKPSFDANENFVLNITLNNSGTISETSTECDIADITGNNYTLNCQQNSKINKDNLQVAMSEPDDNNDILLVNFVKNEGNQTTIRYVKKSSGGLSAGAIVAIVLVPIVVLAAVASIIIFLNKKGTPSPQPISADSNTKI